jgi:hypothetical protein
VAQARGHQDGEERHEKESRVAHGNPN